MENQNRPAFTTAQFSLPKDEMLQANVLGLTKREYFAGVALQGILSNSYWIQSTQSIYPENISTLSIKIADELLKHLED